MRDSLTGFFQSIRQGISRLGGWLSAALLRPFRAGPGISSRRGLLIKAPLLAFVLLFIGLYGYFFWQTQAWTNFDPDYPGHYNFAARKLDAGLPVPVAEGQAAPAAPVCQRSGIVDVTSDLIAFNVDENAWISSMLLYKAGLFGLDWDSTPFLDNKASFQRGVNQAIRRTTVELVDSLGRVRGTSGIDSNLQRARSNMQFDEGSWYFGLDPFGPKTPTPSYYRSAMRDLQAFNTTLANCNATFDARADNLIEFLDRISNDIGSTSAMIRERSENHNGGWFDTRADDRFWFAYGQLYGYYGIMAAAGADFDAVITQRGLAPIWGESLKQLRAALRIQPAIISNGREDGWIMPTHLATMGFYILRVRSNLVEMRDILAR
ncbi:DUF2333 family protein [Rhizobium sp. YIM 134829]|uniref:DUF2333 family protein n=1 Tax=Rhizobium sp. YIM 134829 TaxID=3390453 RepID=UPI00397A3A12